jgi:hypothetical protein
VEVETVEHSEYPDASSRNHIARAVKQQSRRLAKREELMKSP